MKHMVHGPCGILNPKSPCMQDGQCTKKYPKQFLCETQSNKDGYPSYRRRSSESGSYTGTLSIKNGDITIDNRWIVPYSPILSRMFDAHINVEICGSAKSIKYICAYIAKGSDQAAFQVMARNNQDEIEVYRSGRYVCANEAAWRIFRFPMHERYPAVVHLSVHLENGQRIYFNESNVQKVLQDPPMTTLTAFFDLCQHDSFAKTLLYCEVPKYYTWQKQKKQFQRRVQGTPHEERIGIYSSDALGRVYTVHVKNMECFCLRLLLHTIRGPTSFAALKTIDKIVYKTFQEVCEITGLLEHDKHWEATMEDATLCRSPSRIRHLFAVLISNCGLSNPQKLWDTHKYFMAEDIIYKMQNEKMDNLSSIQMEASYNEALIQVENFVITMSGKKLDEFGMSRPHHGFTINREIIQEMSYDILELQEYVSTWSSKLVEEQRFFYEFVLNKIINENGGIIFLDAPGGTGKTTILNLLLSRVRMDGKIALAIASSGIAATLLFGGRTAHSTLKLPFNLSQIENPICNISKNSQKAIVLQQCKLLIWDECTMSHKDAIEALDQTLRDFKNNQQIMGGLVVVLAGDFRQTLPIIQRGTPADQIKACIKSSFLWNHVTKMSLKSNMRTRLNNDDSEDFAQFLLQIGNGEIRSNSNDKISFPKTFCNIVYSLSELIDKVFPDISRNYALPEWLCERVILAPKNDNVDAINLLILQEIPGEIRTFYSIDTVVDPDQSVNYPVEFLNSLELSGTPPHKLQMKIGATIILMRNLDPPKLCNGTRLIVTGIKRHIIEATILIGYGKKENVLIPRIPIIPSDTPFEFKRLQFPVRCAFALSINKSQGQTFKVVGLDLSKQCFSHGQLYVGISRVSEGQNLYIHEPNNEICNIVYKQVLK